MKLTPEHVRQVAELANLTLSPAEERTLAADLGEILTHMEKLNELDTSAVEPMAQVLFEAEETATLRDDAGHVPLGQSEALANAPLSGAGCFKVPKVIER